MLLKIPENAAILLLESGGHFQSPLLDTRAFADLAKKCGISANEQRLLTFERLGLFSPIVRLWEPDEDCPSLQLPLTDHKWFDKWWAIDTTQGASHHMPKATGSRKTKAYYSRFQIASLLFTENEFTANLHLETFLDDGVWSEESWLEKREQLTALVRRHLEPDRSTRSFRPAIDLLCQYISDRYYPHSRSNQRTRMVKNGGSSFDELTIRRGRGWTWQAYARAWNPKDAETAFGLTSENLKHAFEALAVEQSFHDPLEDWYQLVQFVSPAQREKLKGAALAAETMRSGAVMLRLLYRDLYGTELANPNEVTGQIITHIPELAIRSDPRRHLEFVVNQFDLNPRPKLMLIVEGLSDEQAVRAIFDGYFGASVGVHGIEVVNLGGISGATGGKDDRFRAILRLVDYQHFHQTFTFLILDNEGYARRLKAEAKTHVSSLRAGRYATRPDYIRLWKHSFEFDNFSDTELATALTAVAAGRAVFSRQELAACRAQKEAGAAMVKLYRDKMGTKPPKIELGQALTEMMLSPSSRKAPQNRPLVKILERVAGLAARNPFPTMQESWERNQASGYLGGLQRPKRSQKVRTKHR